MKRNIPGKPALPSDSLPSQIPSGLRSKSHHICLLCLCASLVPAVAQRGKTGNADTKQGPLPGEKSRNRWGAVVRFQPACPVQVCLQPCQCTADTRNREPKEFRGSSATRTKALESHWSFLSIPAVTAFRTALSPVPLLEENMPDSSCDTQGVGSLGSDPRAPPASTAKRVSVTPRCCGHAQRARCRLGQRCRPRASPTRFSGPLTRGKRRAKAAPTRPWPCRSRRSRGAAARGEGAGGEGAAWLARGSIQAAQLILRGTPRGPGGAFGK